MSMLHVHVPSACPCTVHIYRNARILDCPASSQYGTGLKKTNEAGTDPVRTELTQSGIFFVRYQTKIQDADAGDSFLDADAQLWSFVHLLTKKQMEVIHLHTS
jgi:hypothetical protein